MKVVRTMVIEYETNEVKIIFLLRLYSLANSSLTTTTTSVLELLRAKGSKKI